MVTIHSVSQGTQEWFALREGKWTGSVAVKLLQGKPIPEVTHFTNKWTERGKLFEPQALLAYKVLTGRDYMEVGFVTNNDYPNAGYSPDGISGDRLLEVKCFNGERHKMLLRGEIPVEVIAQIQFGMLICELEVADLIPYNPDDKEEDIKAIEIPRDEKIIANMKKKLGQSFQRRVG